MAQVTPNPTRYDPYKNFKFRLLYGGQVVAAASQVTGLPDSGHKHDQITLESGVTHDTAFQNWTGSLAAATSRQPHTAAPPRDLVLELLDDSGHKLHSYTLRGCNVTRFEAESGSHPEPNVATIHHLTIRYEGLETK